MGCDLLTRYSCAWRDEASHWLHALMTFHPVAASTARPTHGRQNRVRGRFEPRAPAFGRYASAGAPIEPQTEQASEPSAGARTPTRLPLDDIAEIVREVSLFGHATKSPESIDGVSLC